MTPTLTFPTIGARSLQGIEVELPTAFVGERNIVYGDVQRLAKPLGIADRSTIAVFLVDASGQVRWRGAGEFTARLAQELEHTLGDGFSDVAAST